MASVPRYCRNPRPTQRHSRSCRRDHRHWVSSQPRGAAHRWNCFDPAQVFDHTTRLHRGLLFRRGQGTPTQPRWAVANPYSCQCPRQYRCVQTYSRGQAFQLAGVGKEQRLLPVDIFNGALRSQSVNQLGFEPMTVWCWVTSVVMTSGCVIWSPCAWAFQRHAEFVLGRQPIMTEPAGTVAV